MRTPDANLRQTVGNQRRLDGPKTERLRQSSGLHMCMESANVRLCLFPNLCLSLSQALDSVFLPIQTGQDISLPNSMLLSWSICLKKCVGKDSEAVLRLCRKECHDWLLMSAMSVGVLSMGHICHLCTISDLFFFSVFLVLCSLVSIAKWLTLGRAHRVKLTPLSRNQTWTWPHNNNIINHNNGIYICWAFAVL